MEPPPQLSAPWSRPLSSPHRGVAPSALRTVPPAADGRIRRVVRVHPQVGADVDEARHGRPVRADVVADALRVAVAAQRDDRVRGVPLDCQDHGAAGRLDGRPHRVVQLVVRVVGAQAAAVVCTQEAAGAGAQGWGAPAAAAAAAEPAHP